MFMQARDQFIFDANSDLKLGKINDEAFLDRMTSQHDEFCKPIDACCVVPLETKFRKTKKMCF